MPAILLAFVTTLGLKPLPAEPIAALDVTSVEADITQNGGVELLTRLEWLHEQGRYSDAAEEARAALEVLESEGRGSGAEAAAVIDSLVESLIGLKAVNEPEVIALAQRAVAYRESEIGGDPSLKARSIFNLARAHAFRSEIDTALKLATDGLADLESTEGFSRLTAADGRRLIGELHLMNADCATAMTWLEDAVNILTATGASESTQLAGTLQPLGFCLRAIGDLEGAKSVTLRSIELYTARFGPGHPGVARGLTFLGQIQRDSGQLQNAKASLRRSVEIFEQIYGDDSPQLTSALNALGLTLMDLGEYLDAAAAYDRSIAIQRRSGRADSDLSLATMLSNYGILRSRLGNNEEALRSFEEASLIVEKVLGPDHPTLAYPLANRGTLLAEMGRFEEAYPLISRGLEIRTKAYGPDSLEVAHSLLHLVVYYQGTGDIAAAERFALRALRIKEELLPEQHIEIAKIEDLRSRLASDRGDIDASLVLASKVLSIYEAALGPNAKEVADTRLWIAYLDARLQNFAVSLQHALKGEDIGRENAALMFRGLSEDQALEYASARANGLDLLTTIATEFEQCCVTTVAGIFDRIIRARALVTDEMMRRRNLAWLGRDAEGQALAATFSETARKLAQLALTEAEDVDSSNWLLELAQAQENHRRAEMNLARYSERFRSEVRYGRVGRNEVLSALPDGSALVAYVLYTPYSPEELSANSEIAASVEPSNYYAAFIQLAHHDQPVALKLAEAKTIDEAVESLRELIAQEMLAGGRASKQSEQAFRNSAAELRRLVWDGIANQLGDDIHTIFIVPDGSLNFINFAALPDTGSGYLAEREPYFHYLSSERDVALEPARSSGQRLLAVGAPDFDEPNLYASLAGESSSTLAALETPVSTFRGPRPTCARFSSKHFDSLPASSREVTEVANLWQKFLGTDGGAIVMTGSGANEQVFKKEAAGNRVLHFATHGFFIGSDCNSGSNAEADSQSGTKNPLSLAGLVMAGANHREAAGPDEDDGILTAEEIGTLDLHGTEWSVLSACDTGIGEIRNGEGVFGLRRAFRMAGVRTTIMSLWPVEDEAASAWMTALYRRHFIDGKSTMDAVNGASLELLQQRRAKGLSTHPYYWAGFIASGDWR